MAARQTAAGRYPAAFQAKVRRRVVSCGRQLSTGGKAVMLAVLEYRFAGDAVPSVPDLAKELGLTERHVRDLELEVASTGLMFRMSGGQGKPRVFHLNDEALKLWADGGDFEPLTPEPDDGGTPELNDGGLARASWSSSSTTPASSSPATSAAASSAPAASAASAASAFGLPGGANSGSVEGVLADCLRVIGKEFGIRYKGVEDKVRARVERGATPEAFRLACRQARMYARSGELNFVLSVCIDNWLANGVPVDLVEDESAPAPEGDDDPAAPELLSNYRFPEGPRLVEDTDWEPDDEGGPA